MAPAEMEAGRDAQPLIHARSHSRLSPSGARAPSAAPSSPTQSSPTWRRESGTMVRRSFAEAASGRLTAGSGRMWVIALRSVASRVRRSVHDGRCDPFAERPQRCRGLPLRAPRFGIRDQPCAPGVPDKLGVTMLGDDVVELAVHRCLLGGGDRCDQGMSKPAWRHRAFGLSCVLRFEVSGLAERGAPCCGVHRSNRQSWWLSPACHQGASTTALMTSRTRCPQVLLMMQEWTAAIAAVLGFAVFTAGCGSTSGPGSAGAGSTKAKFLAYSRCMRSHGVSDFPDPTTPPGGGVAFVIDAGRGSDLNPNDPAYRAANQACRAALPPGVEGASRPSPKIAAEVRWARCLRAHGVPRFPDPNSEGAFDSAEFNDTTPAFHAASTACAAQQPSGAVSAVPGHS